MKECLYLLVITSTTNAAPIKNTSNLMRNRMRTMLMKQSDNNENIIANDITACTKISHAKKQKYIKN